MNIKEAIEKLFNVIDRVLESVSEDSPKGKKVTWTEALGIAFAAIGLIPAFTALSQLTDDWKSRDAEKKALWLEAFRSRFDLSDDELEVQIENLVAAFLALEGSFVKLRAARIK